MKTQATNTRPRFITSLALSMMFAACSGFACDAKDPQSPASDPPITAQPFSCGNSNAVVKEAHENWSLAEKWQIHVQNVDGPSGVTFTNFDNSRGFKLPLTGRAMHFSYIESNNSANNVLVRFHFVANRQPVTIEKPMTSFLNTTSGAKTMAVEPQFGDIWGNRGGEPWLERVTLVLTHPGKITFGRAYIVQREGKGNKFYYAETIKTDNAGCDVAKL